MKIVEVNNKDPEEAANTKTPNLEPHCLPPLVFEF